MFSGREIRILIVEDNPGDARLLKTYLAESVRPHFVPVEVQTLAAAETILRTQTVEAAVIDLSLPDSAGLDTVRRVVSLRPNLPVVVLTGKDDDQLGIAALECGAQDYLIKNQMSAALISRAVRYAIERQRVQLSQRDAESRFAKEAARLRLVLEHIPAIVWSLDRDLVITSAIGQGLSALGRKADELVGVTLWEFIGERDDGHPTVAAVRRALAGETVLLDAEQAGQFFQSRFQPLRDERGEIAGVAALSINVTDRKKLEDQVRQSQKMEAVGQLAGGVAHDFNNILNVIIGYSDILARTLKDNPECIADIEEIRKVSHRAAELTHQLLAFSRRQALQPRVFNLNQELDESSRMLMRLVGEHIRWETNLQEDLWPIKADPGQIQQVIINLVVNARDAMPDGGTLSIRTSNITLGASETSGYSSAGDYVVMKIADSGVGMTEEVKAHIFEPFFTTKEKGKGTGLGLSLVYGVIRQSNGFVTVESRPGEGASFSVYLPRAVEAVSRPLPRESAPVAGESETILVVEDEEPVQRLVSRILQENGFKVFIAGSGLEALDLVDRLGGRLSLVLTDIVLPDLRGDEVFKRVAAKYPRLKALFMSGYVDKGVGQFTLDENTYFLQKPFSAEALKMKVRAVLDGPAEKIY